MQSADADPGSPSLAARIRGLGPKSFQARLTIALVLLIAVTLTLVSVLVVNRLDDYFTQQQRADLENRSETVLTAVEQLARSDICGNCAVIGIDNMLNPGVIKTFQRNEVQSLVADSLAQANVRIRFGTLDPTTDAPVFVPALNGEVDIPLRATPREGQSQERTTVGPFWQGGGDAGQPFAVEVTLSNPYTFRAQALSNVTGLLAAIALFALGLSVAIASVLARRFTTPLRRLTETSRALAEGDLSQRVSTAEVGAGSVELAELATQFNTMADRVQESVEMIRRDRDRSRDFLADVSHELRTPIAALRTFNELLKGQAGTDPQDRGEFLESSGQQIDRLDWLATNLLELSKLDSGLVLLELRPDDLRAAVEDAVEQADGAAAKRRIALRLHLPDQPVRIRHDPQRIGQVVQNLVLNAIKFTGRSGSVDVSLESLEDGARIAVVDTGVGIDADELPHIFERFYRGSQANEARGSGSGLGLAIVRSIVDMHGGSIEVESQVGRGSRFTVVLPADPRVAEGTPPVSQSAVVGSEATDRTAGATAPETAL
ncbi:MAG TPA: HAMP domain-containing sensor histidine kinase [Candidatus Limnocylindrales bacterium]|nr:HAMP domain-containing sensor histidine kinase [Candidatus Limnocylindrales bacterium]